MSDRPTVVSTEGHVSVPCAIVLLTGLIVCVGLASPLLAQGRMIALSATSVPQGQTVRVTSPACEKPTTVLVDDKIFPATANGSVFELPTASLAPGTHAITTDCGGTRSDPASLAVVAEVQTPSVVCARNLSPRDGMAAPLTSIAADEESRIVKAAKDKLDADTANPNGPHQSYPPPEETSRFLARCDKDWAWTFRLEDSLSLDVLGLREWLQSDTNKRTPLHLFIGDVDLPNVTFSRGSGNPATRTDSQMAVLTFTVDSGSPEERAASRKAWAQILRTARANAWNYGTNEMAVSIGPAGGPPWPSTAKLRINSYPTGISLGALFAVVGLAIVLVALAWKTALLRDPGGKTAPFSLAKHQMAVWFFVIFSAFLFVTVTTGQAAAMSPTALMLIGISGVTGLAAAAIDSRKQAVDSGPRNAVEAERATLTQEIASLAEKRKTVAAGSDEATQIDATTATKRQRLDELAKQSAEKTEPQDRQSQGWATDLLSDEFGLSFHRVQMAAWTAAMAVVFIVGVFRTFGMPDFDATMLGLLGISSGTYLGFKFPERDTTADGAKK